MRPLSSVPPLLLPLLFAGCGPEEQKEDTASQPEPEDTGPPVDTALYGDLEGDRPDEYLEAPEFSARNQHEEERGQDDLLGHPSVLWFYPMANTSG